MKKFALIALVLFMSSICHAGTDDLVGIRIPGLVGSTIAASASSEYVINLDPRKPVGFASLTITISGSGTLQIQHESSNVNNAASFAAAEGSYTSGSDIVTGFTAGAKHIVFDVPFAKYLNLIFTETGGADSVTITEATLVIQ